MGSSVSGQRALEDHTAPVNCVCFSSGPSGRLLLSASDDSTVKVYLVPADAKSSPSRLCTLDHFGGSIKALAVSPDDSQVVTGMANGDVWRWTLPPIGKATRDVGASGSGSIIGRHGGWVAHAAYAPTGMLFATASGDCSVHLWSADGEPVAALDHDAIVHSVAFSACGRMLASTSADNRIRVWKLAGTTATLWRSFACAEDVGHCVWGRAVWDAGEAPAEVLVTVLQFESAMGLYNPHVDEFATLAGHHENAINGVDAASGALIFATASSDHTVALWPLRRAGAEPLVKLRDHDARLMDVAVSRDGSFVASAGRDNRVVLFSVKVDVLTKAARMEPLQPARHHMSVPHALHAHDGAPARRAHSLADGPSPRGHHSAPAPALPHLDSACSGSSRHSRHASIGSTSSASSGRDLMRYALSGDETWRPSPLTVLKQASFGAPSPLTGLKRASSTPAAPSPLSPFSFEDFQRELGEEGDTGSVTRSLRSLCARLRSMPWVGRQVSVEGLTRLRMEHAGRHPGVWEDDGVVAAFDALRAACVAVNDDGDADSVVSGGRPSTPKLTHKPSWGSQPGNPLLAIRTDVASAGQDLLRVSMTPTSGRRRPSAGTPRSSLGRAAAAAAAASAAADTDGDSVGTADVHVVVGDNVWGPPSGSASGGSPNRRQSFFAPHTFPEYVEAALAAGTPSEAASHVAALGTAANREPYLASTITADGVANLQDALVHRFGDPSAWPADLCVALEAVIGMVL